MESIGIQAEGVVLTKEASSPVIIEKFGAT